MDTPIFDELMAVLEDDAQGVYHHKELVSHFGDLACTWCGKDLDPFDFKSVPCTRFSVQETYFLLGISLAHKKDRLDTFLDYGKEAYPRLFTLGEVDRELEKLEKS